MSRAVRLAAAMVWLLAGRAAAQDLRCDNGGVEVRQLGFSGNETFRDFVLESGIETTPSTWWRRTFRLFGQKYCLDTLAVVRDSVRLESFYRRSGFPKARIAYRITRVDPRAATVHFAIAEGPPLLVDSVEFAGLDSVPERDRVLGGLPIAEGERLDYDRLEATRDSIIRRLRNRGYPLAKVYRGFDSDTVAMRAGVSFTVDPGPRTWIGRIDIDVQRAGGQAPRVSPLRVRDALGIREGQLYRESALEGVKRGLYLTEAFRLVNLEPDSASLEDEADSLVTINLSLTEGDLRASRLSMGWATLDCLRTEASHTNYNFMGALRRLDLRARLSKIGIDPPLDFARGLCTRDLRNDPLSDTLNYYVAATVSQASLFGMRTIPSLSLYSERRSEYQAFIRETPIGVIGSAQQGIEGTRPMTWSYQLEYGRTIAQPAFFCAVFNVCEEDARRQLERRTRAATVGWSWSRIDADNFVNPSSGSVTRLELRHASPFVGSSHEIRFSRASFDASVYRPALGGTLALRLRAGAVLGSKLSLTGSPTFVPLQERLYAGGPSTVRGFPQNELGPAIYLPEQYTEVPVPGEDSLRYFRADPAATGQRVVPTGGDNIVVANAELRRRSFFFPDLVQYVLFVDAGQVWNRGRSGTGVNFRDVRVTPGVGLRVFTDIGPVRVDIGYNGYDRPNGPAYFNPAPVGDNAAGQTLRLICVSPGNTLRVRPGTEDSPPVPVDVGDCPATYAPAQRRTFLSRLQFQFSIGQPF